MDLLLYVIGFSFSFFFISLSYWKEDKTLNIMGSISLMIVAIILVGTSIQSTNLVATSSIVTIDPDINATITNFTYSQQLQNHGFWLESLGIGVMLAIFTSIQYLYFSLSYEMTRRNVE